MRRELPVLGLLVVIAALLLGAFGCSSVPEEKVKEAQAPAAWDLSTPESAVKSYLSWVSFSYRMANSEIPTATMTPEEGVRVDSYIQLNRMEGKGIEQTLDAFEITSASQDTSSATVTARETWAYRYFSLDTLKYVSEPLSASYDTTYRLVLDQAGWLVDSVKAEAKGEVQ